MNKLFNMNLIFCVIFVSLIVSGLGESKTLSCRQLEKNYSKCQLKHYWFGRVSRPTKNFRLTNTDVKIHRQKDGDGDYHTYHKLVLYEKDKPIEFYKHKATVLFDDAQFDKKRIDTFLIEGNEGEQLKIHFQSYLGIVKDLIDFTFIAITCLTLSFLVLGVLALFSHGSYEGLD